MTPMGSRMPCSERSPEKGVISGFLEWGRGPNRQGAEKRRREKRRKEIAKIGGRIFLSLFAARKRREEKVIADAPRLDLPLPIEKQCVYSVQLWVGIIGRGTGAS